MTKISKFEQSQDQDLKKIVAGIAGFMDAARSKSTREAYLSDWKAFTDFCDAHELDAMPATPQTVCAYITKMAQIGRKVATISRHLTTISQAHQAFKKRNPTGDHDVTQCLRGIRRKIGVLQKKAKALVWPDLQKVIDATRPTFIGKRDKALLLVGWAGALRRSEIVDLDLEDIKFVSEGMIITIRRSKTDQEGEGYAVGIPFAQDNRYCPTTALKNWILIARIESGPLFFAVGTAGRLFVCVPCRSSRLNPRSVNSILARCLKKAGINTSGYSGHSLRSGFITSAAKARIPEHIIQIHTRHLSAKILRGYIREGNFFTENPASVLFAESVSYPHPCCDI